MSTADTIRQLGEQLEPAIIRMRRHFHRSPELSGQEYDTSALICECLDEWGIEYRRLSARPGANDGARRESFDTGIIATIRGTAPDAFDAHGEPAMRIALRTDIDALPIRERTDAPFASARDGVMHACGHDCHMAMMMGAVHILDHLRDQLKGEVRILFQPAEETSMGARDMIAAGALDGVDAIYGAHIWSDVDAGAFSVQSGPRMASTDWFRIDIEGVSAHGSMPHKGVDAIVVASEMVTTLQTLVSRGVSPFEPIVITVGEIHGGEAPNILADNVYMTGTVRAWNDKTRSVVADRLERVCGKVAHALGAQIEFDYETGNPGLSNDSHLADVAAEAVTELFGQEALVDYEGTLAGEDFSEYLQHVPGVFAFIGTRNPDVDAVYPQHSCHYTVDESVLAPGAMLAAQWACDMLA